VSSLFKVAIDQANAKRERRVLLPVPGSPGVDLLFRTATSDDIASSQKGGTRLYPKNELLAMHQANVSLLANCCLEIWQNGETTFLESGDPATFTDRETQADLGVPTAGEAVVKLVGRDFDVDALAAALLRESGFDPDGAPLESTENPT